MVCPACGVANRVNARACAVCGASSSRAYPAPCPMTTSFATVPLPRFAGPSPVTPATGTLTADHAGDDTPSPYTPAPGPVDRENFFDAQQRHRRATWRLTAACGFGAVVTGIPLSLVLTPIVYAIILVLTRVVDLFVPVPDAVWNAYERIGLVFGEIIEALDDPASPGVSEGDISRVPLDLILAAGSIFVIPGILLMLAIWSSLRGLFRHAGAGGVLLSIGVREPRLDDYEERQLINVLEELAIAAGVPAPRVMMIDADVANAAAVGSSPEDATIVVSRALLDDLNRDETQGVLAHAVASIGNGDLSGALSLVAIFQTFGFANALVKAPVSGPARRTVSRVVRYVFSRHRSHDADSEARLVSGMLTGGLWESEEDDFQWVNETATPPAERPGPSFDLVKFVPHTAMLLFFGGIVLESFEIVPKGTKSLALLTLTGGVIWLAWYQREYAEWRIRRLGRWARVMLMLPYYIAAMVPQILLMILIPFVLEPLVSLLWRTRRYLADASAVQLTRNPDGLASGLMALVRRGGIIPGGKWAAPLFVTGGSFVTVPTGELQRQQTLARARGRDPEEDNAGIGRVLNERRGTFSSVSGNQPTPALAGTMEAVETADANDTFSGATSSVLRFHPPLNKRLNRLHAMGATTGRSGGLAQPVTAPRSYVGRFPPTANAIVMLPVLFGLIVAWVVLMAVAIGLLLAISVTACGFMMAIVWGLFGVLIGT